VDPDISLRQAHTADYPSVTSLATTGSSMMIPFILLNQSRSEVINSNKEEDNPDAMSPIHEMVMKTHHAMPFVPLQVKT
jgi:hypothetical protein